MIVSCEYKCEGDCEDSPMYDEEGNEITLTCGEVNAAVFHPASGGHPDKFSDDSSGSGCKCHYVPPDQPPVKQDRQSVDAFHYDQEVIRKIQGKTFYNKKKDDKVGRKPIKGSWKWIFVNNEPKLAFVVSK